MLWWLPPVLEYGSAVIRHTSRARERDISHGRRTQRSPGTELSELYPTRVRALATMVGSTLRGLSAVVAPIALGQLLARAGGISWMFAVFTVVLGVGLAVFARFGIETTRRTLEELAQ
jgi:hypothetical protein